MADIFVMIFNIILFSILSFLFIIKPAIPAKILYKKSQITKLEKGIRIIRALGLLFFLMLFISILKFLD